jgi:hypothetical protein
MRKGRQIKLKKINAKMATNNILKRYCLVILGKKKCLRFDFNDIPPSHKYKKQGLIICQKLDQPYGYFSGDTIVCCETERP